jgi:hypothetical protein
MVASGHADRGALVRRDDVVGRRGVVRDVVAEVLEQRVGHAREERGPALLHRLEEALGLHALLVRLWRAKTARLGVTGGPL